MESTARTTRRPPVAQVVKEHPHRSELASLCFDVIRRQARGRTLFSGRKYMRARAREHHVLRKRAGTQAGHVLDILERGPAEGTEAELIAAFAVDGLGRMLDEKDDGGVADEFVQLGDWLSLATPYQPYRHVEQLLSVSAQQALSGALERSLRSDDPGPRPAALCRLEALYALRGAESLAKLGSELSDPVLAAVALALAGERHSSARPIALGSVSAEGELVAASGTSVLRVLGWVTGWALLRRMAMGLLWTVGLRRTGGIWVEGRVVRCERTTALFGRQVHIIDESLRVEEVRAMVRVLRHPTWVGVVGALCLLAGILGMGVAVDTALHSESMAPLGWGLGALGIGAGLDLLLDFVAKTRRSRVWLEIVAPDRPPMRIADVDPTAAERLVRAVEAAR